MHREYLFVSVVGNVNSSVATRTADFWSSSYKKYFFRWGGGLSKLQTWISRSSYSSLRLLRSNCTVPLQFPSVKVARRARWMSTAGMLAPAE